VQKELEDYANQLKVTLDAMRKEYETKVGEFQSKQDVMTDIIKETKIKEITDQRRISMGEWVRDAVALTLSNIKQEGDQMHD